VLPDDTPTEEELLLLRNEVATTEAEASESALKLMNRQRELQDGTAELKPQPAPVKETKEASAKLQKPGKKVSRPGSTQLAKTPGDQSNSAKDSDPCTPEQLAEIMAYLEHLKCTRENAKKILARRGKSKFADLNQGQAMQLIHDLKVKANMEDVPF
jgi:hypothetical protein